MAAIRARGQPCVGSAQWIQDENAQMSLFCSQEAEDFAFSARNEVEWLNEHMAEIFSKEPVNVTDIFKTPGKLRGKTPRTARKRNPLENREPLTDIFATTAQFPLSSQPKSRGRAISPPKIAAFTVAEDVSVLETEAKDTNAITDSGYHGLLEDDVEVDAPNVQSPAGTHDTLEDFPHSPSQTQPPAHSERHSTTETSFQSAREELTKTSPRNNAGAAKETQMVAENLHRNPAQEIQQEEHSFSKDVMDLDAVEKEVDQNLVDDESRSSSQVSSPARTLVRKSSLTFAALPARQPITTKKSIGARVSRTSHLDQTKGANLPEGFLGRITGGMSLSGTKQLDTTIFQGQCTINNNKDPIERPQTAREVSDTDSKMTRLHNKSSTQRLHERINLLGKSQPPRPTKSIPAVPSTTQPQYPDLPKQDQTKQAVAPILQPKALAANEEDDDDWIQPPESHETKPRPQITKSISTDVMEHIRGKQTIGHEQFNSQDKLMPFSQGTEVPSPDSRRARAASTSQSSIVDVTDVQKSPNKSEAVEASFPGSESAGDASRTPIESPSSKRYVDGPLSASKSKLQSIMKTARGLFSSSAGISAQAKMETTSPSLARTKDDVATKGPTTKLQCEVAESLHLQAPKASKEATAPMEVRKTRSSTEKEERMAQKEQAERQQNEAGKQKARQQEQALEKQVQVHEMQREAPEPQRKSARISPSKLGHQEVEKTQPEHIDSESALYSMGPPASHASGRSSQMQRPKDVRRPVKPAKDTAPKAKAPPVNIRVGMPSQRVPLTNAALSSSLQESLPSAQPKQPGMVKKASTASLQSSVSNSNLKSSTVTSKPKALIAAERKKEQDEKEAQRKLDQKREMERKRAAQQGEARRQEQFQRQEADRQRERERAAAAEDPKKIAQRQAIEKRRLEMQKKEQQPPIAPPTMHQQHASTAARPELGGARPPSRQQQMPDHPRHAPSHHASNPSKGAIKRVFDPEADDAPARPARAQGGPSYQQHGAKRRKSEDEEPEEFPIRPTMAPPIRQSGIRKDGPKASIFNNNYNPAPPPASHHAHAPSLLKATTANQAYQQHVYQNQQPRQGYHPDTSKYRDGNKIPFAENPNPPHHQHAQPYKTPLPSRVAQPPKNSPQYTNGENIHLAEIPTDSEDSESSPDTAQKRTKSASLPEWAQSPALRDLLEHQEEHLDADAVFGPVPSPRIEEIFRERHHRFRSRTSSANWAGQDRLTDEEIRRDAEARARMRRDGGWTFGM